MNKKFDVVKRDVKLFGRLRKDGTPTKRSQLMIYVNESGQYLLYADYAHMGLAKSRTRYSAFLDPKSDGRQRNFTTMAFEERITGRLAHRQGDTILNMVTLSHSLDIPKAEWSRNFS